MSTAIASPFLSSSLDHAIPTSNSSVTVDGESDDMTSLRQTWNHLYRTKLPQLAHQRSTAQPKWPVALDHCFARVILDNAVGINKPWTKIVKAPATANMDAQQLREAIRLAERIVNGSADLVRLDQRSLELRGKEKGNSMKRNEIGSKDRDTEQDEEGIGEETQQDAKKPRTRKGQVADMWAQYSAADGQQPLPSPPHSSTDSASSENSRDEPNCLTIEPDLDVVRSRIANHPSLTPYRKLVLTLLTQVPSGRYTTYKALAEAANHASQKPGGGASGNARAVGGAMRNNPFAPAAPCHRVLAADGRIGGFSGECGAGVGPGSAKKRKSTVEEEEGRFVQEKRRLLREEGVRFDGSGKVVGQPFTAFA